jgi:hypothetical protein
MKLTAFRNKAICRKASEVVEKIIADQEKAKAKAKKYEE